MSYKRPYLDDEFMDEDDLRAFEEFCDQVDDFGNPDNIVFDELDLELSDEDFISKFAVMMILDQVKNVSTWVKRFKQKIGQTFANGSYFSEADLKLSEKDFVSKYGVAMIRMLAPDPAKMVAKEKQILSDWFAECRRQGIPL